MVEKEQSDLLTNFFQQTRTGKMSLITLIQNLPDKTLPLIPEMIYDNNGRYLKLKQEDSFRRTLPMKSFEHIEKDNQSINDIIQQRTSTAIETEMSNVSREQRYRSIANEFNLSSFDIEKQYQLALKNRVEIPPILMRRIIIDAIEILHIMINELNQDVEKSHEKSKRISKRLKELETYDKLLDRHC